MSRRDHRQPNVVVAREVHGLLDILYVLGLDHEVWAKRPLELFEDTRKFRLPNAIGGPALVAEEEFTPRWCHHAVRRQSSIRERRHNSRMLNTRGGQKGQSEQEIQDCHVVLREMPIQAAWRRCNIRAAAIILLYQEPFCQVLSEAWATIYIYFPAAASRYVAVQQSNGWHTESHVNIEYSG
jgi:hypothetical protein